jgi:hypothetical protein
MQNEVYQDNFQCEFKLIFFFPGQVKTKLIRSIISISSFIEYYTRNEYYSFVFYHHFQYTQERKLIKQNHSIVLLFTGVYLLNEIELSIDSFSLLFSYNYSDEKKEEEKLLTSYDFTSSARID